MGSQAENEKLLAWHRVLLSEGMTIAYRIADNRPLSEAFLEDLAFSLEALASRVRREKKGGVNE